MIAGKTSPEYQAQTPVSIPIPTLRRLPLYHHYLTELSNTGMKFVSCTTIAQALNLVPVQVRKDLAMTGVSGKPKVGYAAADLLGAIERFLHWDNTSEAFLAGVGHLGSALLGYGGFREYGLDIVAAFDVNPDIVGKEVCGKRILPLEKLPDLVHRMNVKIGILTVPVSAAQEVAFLMANAGILAIWNFAPVPIQVPEDVFVQQEDLASSLAVLSQQLQLKMAQRHGEGKTP